MKHSWADHGHPVYGPILNRLDELITKDRRIKKMIRKCKSLLVGVMMLLATAAGTALAQSPEQSKPNKEKMPGHMADKDHMAKMDKLSMEDKTAMMDKMTTREHVAFMKMTGHDMPNMTDKEHMDMMGKMSNQEKADAFDKMPMEKRMAMMRKKNLRKGDKMEKMDKN